MTLPASGTISMSQIKTEFSGPNNLTAYYRSGTYVPNTPANAAIPASGTIKLTDFYGASVAPAFTPVARTYTTGSSVTETVPTGATHVRIGLWISGDGGSAGDGTFGGYGGDGGGYKESYYSCTGGQTLAYTVDAGGAGGSYPAGGGAQGAGSVISGTLSITTMNNSGGGNVSNYNGSAGSPNVGTTGGNGGAGVSATCGGVSYSSATGGRGGGRFISGVNGSRGQVVFYYT
jgi:hypothetical protein